MSPNFEDTILKELYWTFSSQSPFMQQIIPRFLVDLEQFPHLGKLSFGERKTLTIVTCVSDRGGKQEAVLRV